MTPAQREQGARLEHEHRDDQYIENGKEVAVGDRRARVERIGGELLPRKDVDNRPDRRDTEQFLPSWGTWSFDAFRGNRRGHARR